MLSQPVSKNVYMPHVPPEVFVLLV